MKENGHIKEMFLYGMSAIDFFGEMKRISAIRVTHKIPPYSSIDHLISEAFDVASNSYGSYIKGWEGDVRETNGVEEIYLFSLPAPESVEYGICWKQENNGDTFVYSPFRLPWLDEYLMES
jgi:hypothetical protein